MHRREFSLDLARPLATARGDVTERRGFLVGVEHCGARGVGEATPLSGWTESMPECETELDALVDAAEPDVPPEFPAAAHAVELATADAAARTEGISLAERISAETFGDRNVASSVPVNGTIGDAPVEETVTVAERLVDDGFDCLKLKVGARPPEADLARVRAVREVAGDGVTLRADANGAWDRATAEQLLDAFADLDIAYVEQPLRADDLAGHAALRGRGVDVALDESLARADIGDVLAGGYADVAVLKPMAVGGPLRTVRAARTAFHHGVRPVVTTTVDAAVARAAAVHVAAALPAVPACGLATADLLAAELDDGPDPVPVENGRIEVPAGPGNLGERFDALLWD